MEATVSYISSFVLERQQEEKISAVSAASKVATRSGFECGMV